MSIGLTSATGPGYTITNLTTLGPLNYNAPYTIMGWIYVTTCFPDQTVFSLNDNTTNLVNTTDTKNRDVFMLATAGTAAAPGTAMNMRCYSTTAGVSTLLSTTTTLPIKQNTWHHVAIVRQSVTALEAYVDGVKVLTNGNAITSRTTTIKRFDIGRDPLTGNGIIGRIAHVKVWTRALTVAEIVQERGYVGPVNSSSIFAWYPTKPSAGASRVVDLSGNGKTLSLSALGTTPLPVDDGNPPSVVTRYLSLPGRLLQFATHRKQITKRHAAILSFIHTQKKIMVRRHSATLNFTADSIKGYVRTLIATLAFTRQLQTIKQRITAIGGTLRFVGIHRRQITKRLVGSLNMNGAIGRGLLRTMIAVLSFTGRLNQVRTRLMLLSGSLGFSSTAIRNSTRRLVGNLSFARILQNMSARLIRVDGLLRVTGSTSTLAGRIINLVGTLFTRGVTGRSYSKLLLGDLSFNGGPLRSFRRVLVGLLTFGVDIMILRKGVISIYRDLRFNGVARRTIMRRLAGVLGFIGRFGKGQIKTLQGTLILNGSTGRGLLRKLGGVLIMIGLFPRNQIIKLVRTLRFNGFLNKFSDKHLIVRVIHLVGEWLTAHGLMGNWKTDHDLDGEIDE